LRFVDQAGKVGHATLRIGDSALFLSDEFPGLCSSPDKYGGSSVLLHLYVEDVDRVARQAVAAGAKLLIAVDDRPWGDRQGRLDDPFGHIWRVSMHAEDVSAQELSKRIGPEWPLGS
jgi:PhnB protein